MRRILVTGACGQVGSELIPALQERYGTSNVVATDMVTNPGEELLNWESFHFMDCTDIKSIEEIVKKYNIGVIYHLAAVLSAKAEANPRLTWDIKPHQAVIVIHIFGRIPQLLEFIFKDIRETL